MLYAVYAQQLTGQFVDGEDVLDEMLLRIPESGIANGTRIAIYGFDVFTGEMNRLITALAKQTDDVRALIVMEPDDVFSPVIDSANRLQKMAAESGVSCKLRILRTLPGSICTLPASPSQAFLPASGFTPLRILILKRILPPRKWCCCMNAGFNTEKWRLLWEI